MAVVITAKDTVTDIIPTKTETAKINHQSLKNFYRRRRNPKRREE
jgi:hypothetical protein